MVRSVALAIAEGEGWKYFLGKGGKWGEGRTGGMEGGR
jgi:hypothetical protein